MKTLHAGEFAWQTAMYCILVLKLQLIYYNHIHIHNSNTIIYILENYLFKKEVGRRINFFQSCTICFVCISFQEDISNLFQDEIVHTIIK